MTRLAVLCNVVLFSFTCFVLATDGAPDKPAYIILTLALLLIPIFTVFAIVRSGAGRRTAMGRVAAICNIVLLAFICWAFVDQYPHPKDPGLVEFTILTVLTPILSAVVLLRSVQSNRRLCPQMKQGATGAEGDR